MDGSVVRATVKTRPNVGLHPARALPRAPHTPMHVPRAPARALAAGPDPFGDDRRAVSRPVPHAARRVRVWALSDLHLGGWSRFEPVAVPNADVAVVAGDVCEGLVHAVEWAARAVRPHMPVVMVAGNHEFYGTVVADELARGQDAAARLGVELLENRTVHVAGLRFSGCTLWTDYELDGAERAEAAMEAASRGLPDHVSILAAQDPDGTAWAFSPTEALRRHLRSRIFLETALCRNHTDAPHQVVVTHHAPHPRSVHPAYVGSPLNPAFASDLGGLIAAAQPVLWVHGHTHARLDYRVGPTRVVCNPKGYVGENARFEPSLVVEVGDA